MSQRTEPTAGPTWNDMDAELTLVACDGTQFSIRASQLERLSDVFRSMLEVPQPEHLAASTVDNTVHLSEDATTLRALLDLTATGVDAATRIDTLSLAQLERFLAAADKYDVPAARPLVVSSLKQRAEAQDPWHLFVVAKRFKFADLAVFVRPKLIQARLDAVPHQINLNYLSGADIYSIILERKQRVDRFCNALKSARCDAPFWHYNQTQPQFCQCDSYHVIAHSAWSAVKVAAILAYNTEPSVNALLRNDEFLEGTIFCPTSRSRLTYLIQDRYEYCIACPVTIDSRAGNFCSGGSVSSRGFEHVKASKSNNDYF